ncbi:MerR family transcriptional regulator [Janibacter indicus]
MTDAHVHIGEVATRTGLSHRTIRYYEEMGLLAPSARTEGGFRLYDEAGIERLLLIKPMKPLGFSVEQMRQLLDALDALADQESADSAAARAQVDAIRQEALTRVAELKEATARAEAFTDRLTRIFPPTV